MISAICAKCQILLVEANNNSDANLGLAVNEAVTPRRRRGLQQLRRRRVPNPRAVKAPPTTTIRVSRSSRAPATKATAWSSRRPPDTSRPWAARALTQLTDTGTRDGSESAWSGAGAGCSAYEPKPSWQQDIGCQNRSVADVSAVANPETGVWVYDSYQARGWEIYGGTSVASPIIASFYALAGNPRGSSATPAEFPYSNQGSLYDVTSGSDGSCSPAYLCTAGAGYDGPTGLGSPGDPPDSIAAFRQGSAPPRLRRHRSRRARRPA